MVSELFYSCQCFKFACVSRSTSASGPASVAIVTDLSLLWECCNFLLFITFILSLMSPFSSCWLECFTPVLLQFYLFPQLLVLQVYSFLLTVSACIATGRYRICPQSGFSILGTPVPCLWLAYYCRAVSPFLYGP